MFGIQSILSRSAKRKAILPAHSNTYTFTQTHPVCRVAPVFRPRQATSWSSNNPSSNNPSKQANRVRIAAHSHAKRYTPGSKEKNYDCKGSRHAANSSRKKGNNTGKAGPLTHGNGIAPYTIIIIISPPPTHRTLGYSWQEIDRLIHPEWPA